MGIHLRSEGCNDPAKTPATCGLAYMYVDGIDSSPHLRGHNVVVVDAKTGNVFSRISHLGNLRMFALIVSVHPYCARKFTRHVMLERALSNKINSDRVDGHYYSFAWI